MSGMYNVVLGDGNEAIRGSVVITTLGIDPEDLPRFRDAFIERDDEHGAVLALYTRAGGGNRRDYETQIEALRSNPFYLRDADDELDSTYATFRFRLPREDETTGWDDGWPKARRTVLENAIDPVDTDQRWRDVLNPTKVKD